MADLARDEAVVTVQIGRLPRAPVEVGARCGLGLPVLTVVPPVLSSGEPFPTRYWLTCPLAHRRIARIESSGRIAELEERSQQDQDFYSALEAAHLRYAADRDALIPDKAVHRPHGGVGGTRRGIKCLHAHFSDYLAGNPNPVAAEIRAEVEPLNCTRPCIRFENHEAERNPEWSEPHLDPPNLG